MRNQPHALSTEERAVVFANRDALADALAEGRAVRFTYTKANGDRSLREGTVIEFAGANSTASVKVETDKGARTFNLTGISDIR